MRRLLVVFALAACACVAPADEHPALRCGPDQRCPIGRVCHRGFCVRDAVACEAGAAFPCWPAGTAGCREDGNGGYVCSGVCRAGSSRCDGETVGPCTGAITPTPGPDGCTPAGTIALDDDCDGRIDEDCTCVDGSTQRCFDGPAGAAGIADCSAGAQACTAGRWTECAAAVTPRPETCLDRGRDDDCDGDPDDVPGTGMECTVPGARGACRQGTLQCAGGSMPDCLGPDPMAETCNATDDDCDGTIDEGEMGAARCGECARGCISGTFCSEGLCCASGTRNCGGVCIDVLGSLAHCGGCGNLCPPTFACRRGVCCPPGTENCGGVCVNLQDSESSCGACGNACDGGDACMRGVCCPVDRLNCGGECIDPRQSRNHCGACGVACDTDQECREAICVDRDSSGPG